jgi:uncharacterized protein (TIGR02646 family)
MIRLPDRALPPQQATALQRLQVKVDAAGSYADQVAEGKRLFRLRNKRGNRLFDAVKSELDQMCSGERRCAYCEDSAADEVEHVRPKDLYPQNVFAWSNYIYACGTCNGPKRNRFAVFIARSIKPVEVARKPDARICPPRDGRPVFIDPRVEDASKLMNLDLEGTFYFRPLAPRGTRDHARAVYTIKVLRLNARDDLRRARHAAYKVYLVHLRHYRDERDRNVPTSRLIELREDIKRLQHPTVWREMQCQKDNKKLPELRALFVEVPEAATW